MPQITIHVPHLDSLNNAAQEFAAHMGKYTVFAFNGSMGAGKTTFINALAKILGVTDDMANSPSFSIINEYNSSTDGKPIYHFDLYRLESLEEALDIGVEDYFDSGSVCLIEWPDRVEAILPEDTVEVDICVNHEDLSRDITITFPK